MSQAWGFLFVHREMVGMAATRGEGSLGEPSTLSPGKGERLWDQIRAREEDLRHLSAAEQANTAERVATACFR